jgi:replicative superfamily II helicase
MTAPLGALILASGAVALSARAEDRAITDRVRSSTRLEEADSTLSLLRSAQLLEGEALHSETNSVRLYDAAFSCWRDVVTIGSFERDELDGDLLDESLSLALHLAVTGTLARRTSEVRQALSALLPDAETLRATKAPSDWSRALLESSVKAIVLLTRKDGGWSDIDAALSILGSLRELQTQFEDQYLEESDDGRAAAVELVAIYHLAQMATVAGTYIEKGEGAANGHLVRLDTHLNQAQTAIEVLGNGRLRRLADLLHALLKSLVRHSVWNQVEGMGDEVKKLVDSMAGRGNNHPFLELWPSQEDALKENFLDTYRRAVIVEMPTSAGKTLLAEFAIVQTYALNKTATIAYVVPTRALVNQITDLLRRDLGSLGMTVEQAVPIFELDPTESAMLSNDLPDVLVTTPEKLDLLIRTDHASLQNLSLVVVDEAHNLSDGERGARLELVLATIKRDRPGARYLLLSPFVPNAEDLVDWLGDDRGLAPIKIQWQPNKRVVGALEVEGKGKNSQIVLRTIRAIDNSHLPEGVRIPLGSLPKKPRGLKGIAAEAAHMLSNRGRTLIVCTGRSYAVDRALEVSEGRLSRKLNAFGEAVIRHTEAELGVNNTLARSLRKGVAYHHAGVSMETRRFVEALMRQDQIDTICGTSTLAQGVNFPLSNVIIEGRAKGRYGTLSYSDFWNIAGRAGRGLNSDLGVVGFPAESDEQKLKWQEFFQGEATAIASQLATVVTNADSIGAKIDQAAVRNTEGLSAFLQYLAHAMKVSGSLDAANEIEDLLRSSLIYRQLESKSKTDATRLVNLCRLYLDGIRGKGGLVSLADGTGFSTPTINGLLNGTRFLPELASRSTWEPSALFGADISGLTTRIRLISDLPEMQLSDQAGGLFDPERIARIVRDWVNGVPVNEMASTFGSQSGTDISRIAKFAGYLHSSISSLASWGMGALESVALAGAEQDPSSDADHVPSMIYFGVNDKESVWLRMAGLTREAAPGAAILWRKENRGDPKSFKEVRTWLNSVDDAQWDSVIGESPLRGPDMKLLWAELQR